MSTAAGGRRGEAGEAEEEDAEEEDAQQHAAYAAMRCIPAYPFPAEFQLEFQGTHIDVCQHLCPQHPGGTRAIVMFFPGVHGGVGPCRQPGADHDAAALFPTVARALAENGAAGVDCYRLSWPFMRPKMRYALSGATRVLHNALLEAASGEGGQRELRVFFVGHSFGGAVAVRAAELVAQHFGANGEGARHVAGLEKALVRVAGLCTLNGAVDVEALRSSQALASLASMRALLVCGDADAVVEPEISGELYEALPMAAKRHLVLPGGSHDLYTYKDRLVHELTSFILDGLVVGDS